MDTNLSRGFALAVLIVLGGCSGPLLWLPGGALSGPEAPLSAAPVPAEGGVLVLETRPENPYSVNIGYTVIDGQIYVDPAAERQWYQYMAANPEVRIRLEGSQSVYPALAVAVEDPQLLARFEPDRMVLRFEAR
ncbi:MAG: hypothetical protein ACFHXK_05760 [bacterium]